MNLAGSVKIGNRLIGKKSSCFIVGEIGNNHNGSVKEAFRLIDIAVEAGCDAVKFQMFEGKDIVLPSVSARDYPGWDGGKKYSRWIDFLDALSLSRHDFRRILDYAREKKIICIMTACSREAVDFLEAIGIAAYKVASMDVTNWPLLERINLTAKPVILSCAMASVQEIARALDILFCCDVVLMHCVSHYPLNIGQANLDRIAELGKAFKVPVGFSDHSLGTEIACLARGRGACCIEKHVTFSRSQEKKAEHHFSLEPGELKDLVRYLRKIKPGISAVACEVSEKPVDRVNRKKLRRGWWYARNLKKGAIVSTRDALFVRPENSLTTSYDNILGRMLKNDVKRYCPVSRKHFVFARPQIKTFDKVMAKRLARQLSDLDKTGILSLGRQYGAIKWEMDNFLKDLPGKWKFSRVVLVADRVVGFWICSLSSSQALHTHRVFLDQAYRGCNIGKKVFLSILRPARDAGINRMDLEVSVRSHRAQNFYVRLGFKKAGYAQTLSYLKMKKRLAVSRIIKGVITEPTRQKTWLLIKDIKKRVNHDR